MLDFHQRRSSQKKEWLKRRELEDAGFSDPSVLDMIKAIQPLSGAASREAG